MFGRIGGKFCAPLLKFRQSDLENLARPANRPASVSIASVETGLAQSEVGGRF